MAAETIAAAVARGLMQNDADNVNASLISGLPIGAKGFVNIGRWYDVVSGIPIGQPQFQAVANLAQPLPAVSPLTSLQDFVIVCTSYSAHAAATEMREHALFTSFLNTLRSETVEISNDASGEQIGQLAQLFEVRRSQLSDQIKNLEYFEQLLLPGSQFNQAKLEPPKAPARERYWKNVRDGLQQWFPLSLSELASMLGIAKGTLVYIAQPTRTPRPSTARKIMNLHALGTTIINKFGAEAGRAWLATEGLATLREGGIEALDRAVTARLNVRRLSAEAIAVVVGDDTLEPSEYAAPDKLESEAF